MTVTGLFFGSFNPIHVGHMVIANYMIEFGDLDELWFVVSPHNPLKEKKTLLKGFHRLEMVRLAVEEDDRFRESDIEFHMPRPSYTIDTLTYLSEKHPSREFRLVMGSDGLKTFHKWKHADQIIQKYHRLVYPRPGATRERLAEVTNATWMDAPLMDISSSFIRCAIGQGKDVRYMVPPKAYRYMRDMHFYEK